MRVSADIFNQERFSHTKVVSEEVEEERKRKVICEVRGFITHFTDR